MSEPDAEASSRWSRFLPLLVGLALLFGSAGAVFLADRLGWLPGSGAAASAQCPHELTPASCPWCDESLIESKGFCGEHGVPEALCHVCSPGLVIAFKAKGDWCGGHDKPESQCEACNPGVLDKWRTASPKGKPASFSGIELVAAEDQPRHLREPSVTCTTHKTRVRLASPQIARRVGLAFVQIKTRKVALTLTCNAALTYDENRLVRLSARAPGVIHSVSADLGSKLRAGALLADVDSPSLGSTKAAFLRARALVNLWERNHKRELALLKKRVGRKTEVLEAETRLVETRIALASARQSLRNLGLSEPQIAHVASTADTSSHLHVRTPFAGTVVARSAVEGEVVDTSKVLFSVTDPSTLWAILDVPEGQATGLRVGQSVVFRSSGLPAEPATGRITWVSPQVDPHTRMVKARAQIPNPKGLLRANMFGRARVALSAAAPQVLVPRAAVQWEGCCNVVFVRQSETLFEPRKVHLGATFGAYFQVRQGLKAGEVVVTQGSFLLRTEILKESIGAGCCEATPG